MAIFSNAAWASTTLTVTGLSSLVSGSNSQSSSAVDNTATGTSYLNGIVRLGFSASLTATGGAPYIIMFIHPLLDGSTYPSPPGSASTTNPRPNATAIYAQLNAAAYQVVDFGDATQGFGLGPFQYAFQFQNQSGVTFNTVTATLYRWNPQGV